MEEKKYLTQEEINTLKIISKDLSEKGKEKLQFLLEKSMSFDIIKICLLYEENLSQYILTKEDEKLVNNLDKLLNIDIIINEENNYEDYRNMMVIIAQDYRVLIAALLLRLFNMKKLKKEDFPNKVKYGNDSLSLYAPIAHRLGLGSIKSELEELSLYYIDIENYKKISNYLDSKKGQRDKKNKETIEQIDNKLKGIIPNYKIFGRSKSLYSIYKKTIRINKDFSDIYDFQGIRIICNTKEECYSILGVVHDNYTPLPDRFKDYIALKKPNLYQSLHTTVSNDVGDIFEIQIRTRKMDEIAERGIAAHWIYKDENNNSLKDVEEQLHLFRDVIGNNKVEGIKKINKDIFESTIYTFTPNRKIVMLPHNATVIDFAFKIHTKVGENISNAIVNDKIVTFNTILKNGDQVKILTKDNNNSVQKEWLDFVVTSHAKKKIKSYLNNQKSKFDHKRAEEGLRNIKKAIANNKIKYDIINDESLQKKIIKSTRAKDFETLCKDYYLQNITSKDINSFSEEKDMLEAKIVNKKLNKTGVYVKGIDSIKISIAKCCCPVYGDDIVGTIKNGDAIVVHKNNCTRIENSNKIDVYWDTENNNEYLAKVYIEALDRTQLFSDITNALSKQKISLGNINSKVVDNVVRTKLEVFVKNKNQLKDLESSLKNIDSVLEVGEYKN